MKKILKIFIFLLLMGILSFEVYLYFFKEERGNKTIQDDIVETKYLVDIYTPYNNDNLTYNDIVESDRVYYKTISGLKNKDIETIVNNKIKDKINILKNDLDSDKSLSNVIVSNFENTISIGFCYNEKNEYSDTDYYDCYPYEAIDSLNIDLTTGNEIKITDVLNSKKALKEKIVEKSYEDFVKNIGFVYGGVPSKNDEPDYSSIEDQMLQIINKYNKDDYIFIYDPISITLMFKDVDIINTEVCFDEIEGCRKTTVGDEDYKEDIYIKDIHEKQYVLYLELFDLLDNITIYNKFKTVDSIYEKESDIISLKFRTKEDLINNNAFMSENEKELIDYDLLNTYEAKYNNTAKDMLLDEMEYPNSQFTIYNVYGDIYEIGYYDYRDYENSKRYNYVNYDVLKYGLDRNIYLQNKKQIYLDKYSKISDVEGIYYRQNSDNSYQSYPYLNDYLEKQLYYYYIFDDNGKYYDTKDIMDEEYLKSVIPDEWYTIGDYKNYDSMIEDAYIMINEIHTYPNRLVIYDLSSDQIRLKYKGNVITLCNDYDDCKYLKKILYK